MNASKGKGKVFSIMARNRRGELAKLTRYLLDASLQVSDLVVVNAGSRASIRFSTPKEDGLREGLRKSGLRLD